MAKVKYSEVSCYDGAESICWIRSKMNFNRKLKYWLPVILWMGFIFWMSTEEFTAQNTSLFIEPIIRFLLPGASQHAVDVIHDFIRKGGHVGEYFILGLLLFRAFRSGSKARYPLRWAAFALGIVILYASTDEFHQSFVPGRTPSPIDVGIDSVGGILAQVVCVGWQRRRLRRAARL